MFVRKSEFKYITKNTSRDDLVEECRRLKNLVCQLRHVKKKYSANRTQKRDEGVKIWKQRYSKKSYESFKKSQTIWGKDKHIERLRQRIKSVKRIGRKEGYNKAMNRIIVNNYKVKHVAHFLMKTNMVMDIYGLNFREYSFLLWAGRYDFFNRRDFTNTVGDVEINYYATLNSLIKRGLLNSIEKQDGTRLRMFSLTPKGIDIYNRIAKFTNKFLKSDTGTSGIRNNI